MVLFTCLFLALLSSGEIQKDSSFCWPVSGLHKDPVHLSSGLFSHFVLCLSARLPLSCYTGPLCSGRCTCGAMKDFFFFFLTRSLNEGFIWWLSMWLLFSPSTPLCYLRKGTIISVMIYIPPFVASHPSDETGSQTPPGRGYNPPFQSGV